MERTEPLAAAVLHGEAYSFEQVFRTHYGPITRLFQLIVGGNGSAEEVASEVFLKLLQKPRLLAAEHNVAGWLHRTATRAALDAVRRQQRRQRWEWLLHIDRVLDPHKEAVQAEEDTRVRTVLAALPTRDVQLLMARSMDLSYRETAELAEVNPHSVGTLLARAEKAFEKEYRRRYGNK